MKKAYLHIDISRIAALQYVKKQLDRLDDAQLARIMEILLEHKMYYCTVSSVGRDDSLL